MVRRMGVVLCVGVLLMCTQDLARATTDKPLAGVMSRRFMLVSEDGAYSMRLTGRVHFKGQFPMSGPASEADASYLELRRVRTGVEGRLAGYYDYKIEYDFGRGGSVLTDGFLGLTHFDAANIRMGRYKVPFSAEELTSSNSIRFVERSMINRFAPSRMIGISVLGKSGNFSYMAGAFDGAVDGKFLLAGRLTLGVDKFTVGANVLGEDNEGSSALPDLRSGQGTRWYRYHADAVSDGSRTQFGGDLSYWGTPFSFVAELLMGKQDVAMELTQGDPPAVEKRAESLGHMGFMVQAGYVLTGENAAMSGVTPARDFDPATGGMGAFELVARYSQITPDDDAMAFARSGSVETASEITAGVNWYMSRHARLMLNYVQTSFDSEIDGDKSESGVLLRMQLNY